MSLTALTLALLATSAPAAAAPTAMMAAAPELAVPQLVTGNAERALATLEKASVRNPHDAAVLINLGIAYAHAGDDVKARSAFEQALACHEVVELDTADGTATDSRRLARKALKMLARGEFRTAAGTASQLTWREH
jgi:tetratricopeptide (TPR) repeat protein